MPCRPPITEPTTPNSAMIPAIRIAVFIQLNISCVLLVRVARTPLRPISGSSARDASGAPGARCVRVARCMRVSGAPADAALGRSRHDEPFAGLDRAAAQERLGRQAPAARALEFAQLDGAVAAGHHQATGVGE